MLKLAFFSLLLASTAIAAEPDYFMQLEMAKAWRLTRGSSSVKVAILNTGVNYKLPDLSESIAINTDEIDGDSIDNDSNGYVDDVWGVNTFKGTSDPLDAFGLGSSTASLISSKRFGFAPGTKIIPINVCSDIGACSLEAVIRGVRYAVNRGASVISIEMAGIFSEVAVKMACKAISKTRVPVIGLISNGFTSSDMSPGTANFPYDCDADNLILVTASDEDSNLARFSPYSKNKVDLAAPGVRVPALGRDGSESMANGMSPAGAITAAVAALVLSYHPDYTAQEVKRALVMGVDRNLDLEDKVASGGRINAFKALTARVRDQ